MSHHYNPLVFWSMRKGGLSAPKYYKHLSASKNASKPEVSCFYCANAARNNLYGCALNVCKARSTVFRLTPLPSEKLNPLSATAFSASASSRRDQSSVGPSIRVGEPPAKRFSCEIIAVTLKATGSVIAESCDRFIRMTPGTQCCLGKPSH